MEENREQKDKKKIEDIIDGMRCPKDFKCHKSGLNNLCRAKDIGLDAYIQCLEEDSEICKFVLFFGEGKFCRCPLRIYIAKELKK